MFGPVIKAVIPAAGLGTRMRPLSSVVPKELFALGSRPAIEFAIEECVAAGCREIAVVLSPDKQLIRRYLDSLEARDGTHFHYVEQAEPLGLGDAMTRCREFVSAEPFVVALPDNVFLSARHSLRPLVELYAQSGDDVIGVVEVGAEHSGRYGNCGRIDCSEAGPGVLRLSRLYDKLPGRLQVEGGSRIRRTCGRYVCRPEILDVLEALRDTTVGELDEVPAYQRVIAERGAWGVLLEQPLFDVGHPSGFLAAAAELHRQGGH